MKTVLFVDKDEGELWDSYLQYDYLLSEWLSDQEVCVCDWHREGESVQAALPGLAGLLDDDEAWTAVVVTDLREEKNLPCEAKDPSYGNPYDFPENYEVDFSQPLRESTHPIVRISQMLGGIPDRVSLVSASDEESGRITNEYEVYHPRSQDHYAWMERYRPTVSRPRHLVCVTPRSVNADLRYELKVLSDELLTQNAQRFWERNGYAARTRFVVCDFPTAASEVETEVASPAQKLKNQQMHDRCWLNFWFDVLTLASKNFPLRTLQAFKLYRMDVRLNPAALRKASEDRMGVWAAAQDVLKTRIEFEYDRLRQASPEEKKIPHYETHIEVEFEEGKSCLETDPKRVGRYRDIPANDTDIWEEESTLVFDNFREVLWEPRRGTRLAVQEYGAKSSLTKKELEYCLLNPYQFERLNADLAQQEEKLLSTAGSVPFAFRPYEQVLAERSQETQTAIDERSTKASSIATILIVSISFLVGLLPFALGSAGDLRNDLNAGTIAIVCTLVLLIAGFYTIYRQAKRVRKSYEAFNDQVRSFVDGMKSEADSLGKRISLFAQCKKGWSVIERQGCNTCTSEHLEWLRERYALLSERANDLTKLVGGVCTPSENAYKRTTREGWEALEIALGDEEFYKLHGLDSDDRLIRGDVGGEEFVTMPYPFMEDVMLKQVILRAYVTADTPSSGEGGGVC